MGQIKGTVGNKLRRFAVGLLSLAVALSTTAALTSPAITMESRPLCGLEEHRHGEDCNTLIKTCPYGGEEDAVGDTVLICGRTEEEGVHQHTDACRHTHTDDCFSRAPLIKTCPYGGNEDAVGDTVLICGRTEEEGVHQHTDACRHTHTDDCFSRAPLIKTCPYGGDEDAVGDTVLICGRTEEEGVHQHTDACQHTHTDDCFAGTLICDLPEHTHSSVCFGTEAQSAADAPLPENSSPEASTPSVVLPEANATSVVSPEAAVLSEASPEAGSPGEETSPAEAENAEENGRETAPEVDASETETDSMTPAEQVEAPAVTANAAVSDSLSLTANSLTVFSKVTLTNAELKAGQFTFELIDADTQEVLQTAVNQDDGSIAFKPIKFMSDQSGIYRYSVREVKGTDPNITYDQNVYTVSVGVEKGVPSPQTLGEKYYGIISSDPYGWNMSTTPGGRDYLVYCMDATKSSPGKTAAASPYWIAQPDPDESMVRAAVCHTSATTGTGVNVPAYDGWLDYPSLKENLKRILYTVTYGSLSYLDGTQKAQLIWWAASGESYLEYSSMYSKYKRYMYTCLNTTVPSGYQLVIFHSSDSTAQPFITLLKNSETSELQSNGVVFSNTYAATSVPSATGVSVTLKAGKTLDGKAPGAGGIFSFRLYDAEGKLLQTKQNDADGNITFDSLTYTEPGTYTYTIQEVDDGQSGVVYDAEPRTVTVVVTRSSSGATAATSFDFTASSYYGLATGSDDDAMVYYLSKNMGGTDLAAYCIDALKDFPPLAHDLTTNYDRTKYSVVLDPSNATLEGYVGVVKTGGKTEENLRKLLYYIDQHPELSQQKRNALVWTATSKADDFYTSVSQSELDAIYASTTVPSDYHLALFYPSQLGGVRASFASLDDYQPLLTGYYTGGSTLSAECTGAEQCVFENRTSYSLPSTGGIGTPIVICSGLLCTAGSAVMYINYRKKRMGGTSTPENL